MLTVSNLRKEFREVVAVDGVSFDVKRGEIFGLLGPNGAGKSTTIRMILNILDADSGEITYDGRRFSERIRNLIGYLPEERGLYRKNRLLDTILYLSRLRGMEHGIAKREALMWLQRLGLLSAVDKRVEELSKGNQQKVQFVTAIIHNPQLVVLDEPFSGLDPVNQILFKNIMLELRQQNKAVIFSTHQMDQAEKLSDTLCLINRGQVVLGGTVRDVKRRYGHNSIHIEFDGDGAFLEHLTGVVRTLIYQNSAEVEVQDGVAPGSLLPAIAQHLDVRKFEILEPSLHSIFLQVVGEPAAAGAEEGAT